MRKTFYLFRHGQTDYNKNGQLQGQMINAPLNKQGQLDAVRIADILKEKGIELIYSSPLIRARETADIVAARLGVQVKCHNDLIEGCVGFAEGQSIDTLKAVQADIMDRWYGVNLADLDFALTGGESKAQIGRRVLQALKQIAHTTSASVIGIASHGMAIRFLLQVLGHRVAWVDNGAVIRIVLDHDTVHYMGNESKV